MPMIDYQRDCGFGPRDLELLNAFVRKFGHPNAMPMEQYLETWYKEKSKALLPMFGNKCIISEKVTYEVPTDAINTYISEKIISTDEWREVVHWLRSVIYAAIFLNDEHTKRITYDPWETDETVDPIERTTWYYIRDLIDQFGYTYNYTVNKVTIAENFVIKPNPLNHLTKAFSVTKTEKPFRVITHILNDLWPIANRLYPDEFTIKQKNNMVNIIEKYRLIHSQILNNKKSHGNLCISIHPMDFLTASDNKCKWNSCMTWTRYGDPGEYRNGMLEMMNSPIVVIAYLESNSTYYPMGTDYIPWSNKKWRELFIVERSYISGIKGYPYYATDLENAVISKLAAIAKAYGWPAYENNIQSSGGELTQIGNIRGLLTTDLMYNDAYHCGHRYVVSSEPAPNPLFHYSGAAKCIVCGKPLCEHGVPANRDKDDFWEEDYNFHTPYCDDCDLDLHCDRCGGSVTLYPGDYYRIGDKLYCPDCCVECDGCGEPALDNNTTRILFFLDNQSDSWYESTWKTICPDCVAKYQNLIYPVDLSKVARDDSTHFPYWSPRTGFLTLDIRAPHEYLHKLFAKSPRFSKNIPNLLDLSPYRKKFDL